MYPIDAVSFVVMALIAAGYFDGIPLYMFLFLAVLLLIYLYMKPHASIRTQAVREPR